MDDSLIPFYRQYLQQVTPTNLRYPPSKHLVIPFIQDQINRYFFDESRDPYLPPSQYRRKVLKRIIDDVERELVKGNYDPDEYAVSDALMTLMGSLAIAPHISDVEAAQSKRTLSYFLPVNSSTPSNNHEFNANEKQEDHRILIYESPNLLAAGSNVGLRTWEACLYIANYLCVYPDLASKQLDDLSISGANIIELGAGTGLLSLICSLHLGAKHVISTDGLPHVVEGIQANIELNNTSQNLKPGQSLLTSILDWTDPTALDSILEDDDITFDYILGADVTYHPELHEALVGTIRNLKDRSPKARVLISATLRSENTHQHFREVCEQKYGFTVREITDQEWKCSEFKDQTGLFQEQAFQNVIFDIDFANTK